VRLNEKEKLNMFDFLKKKFPKLNESEDSEDITKLLKLLAPLTDTIPILSIMSSFSENQKFLIRNSPFLWGYLNNLVSLNAIKLSISRNNHAVLLTSAQELYASMFLIDVELARKEYEQIHKDIKKDKSAKDLFVNGANACVEDMKQINIEVPNRLHLLDKLHAFLTIKCKEVKDNER